VRRQHGAVDSAAGPAQAREAEMQLLPVMLHTTLHAAAVGGFSGTFLKNDINE
jgi:hypothetical protein